MRRTIIALALALSLALARPAEATVNMARSDGTVAWASGGATVAYPISNCDTVRVQIWSSAGSVASVNVDVRSSSTAPWFTVATIANPSATGEYWSIPRAIDIRVNVTGYVSGTISANLEGYRNGERVW
jgi:predicted secreted protein